MKRVNMRFGMNISFNPSYYQKLGLKGKGFQQPLENTLDHALHDAETIIKREVPRPGHSRSTTGYKPTGNLQRTITKHKPNPLTNQNVSFNINGVLYQKVTDKEGIASLNITLLAGEYIITSYWNDFQVGNTIKID